VSPLPPEGALNALRAAGRASMNEQFQKLLERAEQLIGRIESILPQPLAAPADWNASIAWRYRRRCSARG